MLGHWRIGILRGEVWLIPWSSGASAPEGAAALSPHVALRHVAPELASGMLGRIALVEMVQHLDGDAVCGASASTSWLMERVAEALANQRLLAFLVERSTQALVRGEKREPAPKDEPRVEPKEEKTWIAIRLIDDEGNPVAFKRYRIELPDGASREGMLDDKGVAHLDGIDPGTCSVGFPDFVASDWMPA